MSWPARSSLAVKLAAEAVLFSWAEHWTLSTLAAGIVFENESPTMTRRRTAALKRYLAALAESRAALGARAVDQAENHRCGGLLRRGVPADFVLRLERDLDRAALGAAPDYATLTW